MRLTVASALAAFLVTLAAQLAPAAPLGTAFTYQGRLNAGANPANGTYDLQFTLFGVASGGSPATLSVTKSPVGVTNGLFTVTLDFSPGAFNSEARWLEIGVRTNGGGAFVVLSPRQPCDPTPYAIYASYAGSANSATTAFTSQAVTANAVTGAGIASGQVVKSLNGLRDAVAVAAGPNVSLATNANTLTISAAGAGASGGWTTTGNAGTTPTANYLGTTDGQPLEFKVNGQRALRLEPDATSPNVIGGYAGNVVSNGYFGATIGGGGSANGRNRVGANHATVVGGSGNTASGPGSTAMGSGTEARGSGSTAMGSSTTASGDYSTAMGYVTTASGNYSTAMGTSTTASGLFSTALGYATTASGDSSTALGYYSAATNSYTMAAGRQAKANHAGAFVWADSQTAAFSSTGNNQFLIRAMGGVGINKNNPAAALDVAGSVVVQADDTDADSEANQLLIRGTTTTAKQLEIGYKTSGNYATIQAIEQNVAFRPLILQPAGGRVGIGKTDPASALDVNGTVTATAFNPPSDRNLKENFAAVSPREVLEKVTALPISRWNFKGDAATPHVGPMAQDFHAAFALGTDDKHIATVDADGVALAAIQGLNQKLEFENQSVRSALEAKDAKITELEKRLAALEQFIKNQTR